MVVALAADPVARLLFGDTFVACVYDRRELRNGTTVSGMEMERRGRKGNGNIPS